MSRASNPMPARGDVVEDDQVAPLADELLARAHESLRPRVGGEADEDLTGAPLRAELAKDVGRRLERRASSPTRPSAACPRSRSDGPVVGDGRRHHDDVGLVRPRERLAGHVFRRGRLDDLDARGSRTSTFAASSVTSAPRRRASSASATPIRPDERLPTKRTASSGSRVPPAETSTRLPASLPPIPSSVWQRAKMRLRLGHPADARLALGELALLRPDQLDARARAGATRSPAWPGAPTCGRSSPARRASRPRNASAVCVRTLSAMPARELRHRVRRERRDDEQVGVEQVRVELGRRLATRQRLERLPGDEASRRRA